MLIRKNDNICIVATICQMLWLKCTKFDFGWGSASNPLGKFTAHPRPPSWISGGLLLRGGKGKGGSDRRGGKGEERRGEKGRKEEWNVGPAGWQAAGARPAPHSK